MTNKLILIVLPIFIVVFSMLLIKKSNINFRGNNNSGINSDSNSIDYSTYNMSLKEYIKFFSIFSSIFFISSYVFYESMVVGIIALFLPILLLKKYKEYLMKKRKDALNYQFKDLLYSISSYINAGKDMKFAIEKSLENLQGIYNLDDYIIIELKYIVKRINETNDNVEKAIKDFAIRSEVEDIYDFADVYGICRSTGGDLDSVIDKTSRIIIEKINIGKEIKMITSQKKFEAKALMLMPLAIIILIRFSSIGFLDYMYTTLGGRIIMTLGLVTIGATYYWSDQITNIEV